jgi:hypothetical protein
VPPGATTVYFGGQNAVDGAGSLVGGDDVAGQTQQVMKNVHVALAAAGASVQDLVMMTVLFSRCGIGSGSTDGVIRTSTTGRFCRRSGR